MSYYFLNYIHILLKSSKLSNFNLLTDIPIDKFYVCYVFE